MKNTLIKLSCLCFILFFVACGDEPSTPLPKVMEGPLFELLSEEASGISFVNKLPETPSMNILTYQYLHNGGGVAIGDINNDGLADIFFTANYGPNHLYLNKGDLKFEEIGRAAGIGGKRGWSTGVTMVDINNDGLLDIYVSRSGNFDARMRENALFVNNGDLTFTEKAEEYGLNDDSYSTQASFFDYDGDGDLDMFQLNHPITPGQGRDFFAVVNDRSQYAGDKLYRNDNGKYIDVSEEAGIIGNNLGYGLSVSTGDLNNDGWPDLYVCNDYLERDYLYFNNQDGTFTEKGKDATRHTSNFSMGSDIADFNNDGLLDIMVADMVAEDNYRSKTNMSGMNPERFNRAVDNGFHYQYMMNSLQMNNGNGTFSEVSQLAGISNTDWSWAPLWADFDNDGLKDLLVTNGLRKEARNNDFVKKKKAYLEQLNANPDQRKPIMRKILDEMPEERIKNYVFKNEGNIRFTNQTENWGLTETSFSNGAAYADLDNDGDLDLVISNVDHPSFIYKNNSENSNNFLKVKFEGSPSNRSGIGVRVEFEGQNGIQMKEHFLNRGYLSSVDNSLHFGVGGLEKIESLKAYWPDGNVQVLKDVSVNEVLVLYYADSEKGSRTRTSVGAEGLFDEVPPSSLGINYKHKENSFDDFEREVLLPHKMSTLGPTMAVADVNGDGLDDFFVGGAKGQLGELMIQQQDGNFKKAVSSFAADKNSEDIAATFFDADSDGDMDLYVVSGGNEYEANDKALQDRLYLNDGLGTFSKSTNSLPVMYSSGGVVTAADYDDDGDMDLFVGGRVTPGAYPKAPKSYLLNNANGIFEDVTASLMPEVQEAGMISSALWTDVNGDGNLDLMVAGEWMPIMIFENQQNTFRNIAEDLGLTDSNGWWYSLAQGDFDGDGDMDYVAGNLGLNYKYKASKEVTFDLYYDDFDNNATGDIVLTYAENGEKYPLRGRECSSQQMPFIKEKFQTYDAFAKANLTDIFGEQNLQTALHLTAKTFASVYIENRGEDGLVIRELPRLAQLSSVNDIVVMDINKDQHLDIILAGNLYASEVETPRNDASNGLILTGNGKGDFRTLSVAESQFFAPGDVKELDIVKTKEASYLSVLNNNDALQFFQLKE